MITVHFTDIAGRTRVLDVAAGRSLMEVAVQNGVEGITGTCGGACSCATCHVKIDGAWASVVGEPSEEEAGMLACVPEADPFSRLACQVTLDERCDGLVVRVGEKLA